jgi:hypothetical protein
MVADAPPKHTGLATVAIKSEKGVIMKTLSLVTTVVLLLCVSPVRAEVIAGQIKQVDADKGILTLTVDGKEQEIQVPPEAKILLTAAVGVQEAKNGLKDVAPWKGFSAQVTTGEVKGKVVVKEVLVRTGRRVDG